MELPNGFAGQLGGTKLHRGEVGETGKNGWHGGVAKQETPKLSNPDSQSGRICAKWH